MVLPLVELLGDMLFEQWIMHDYRAHAHFNDLKSADKLTE